MTTTSGLAEARAPFASSVVSTHGNPGADGRLMIPAALRDAAGIKRGDKVNLRVARWADRGHRGQGGIEKTERHVCAF